MQELARQKEVGAQRHEGERKSCSRRTSALQIAQGSRSSTGQGEAGMSWLHDPVRAVWNFCLGYSLSLFACFVSVGEKGNG